MIKQLEMLVVSADIPKLVDQILLLDDVSPRDVQTVYRALGRVEEQLKRTLSRYPERELPQQDGNTVERNVPYTRVTQLALRAISVHSELIRELTKPYFEELQQRR